MNEYPYFNPYAPYMPMQNKIESLQAQVSELKTQNMFCGVPRISPYGYGVVPNFATPCGCGCNGATF